MKQEIKPTIWVREDAPIGPYGSTVWMVVVIAPYNMRKFPRMQGLRHVAGPKWVFGSEHIDSTSDTIDYLLNNGFEFGAD